MPAKTSWLNRSQERLALATLANFEVLSPAKLKKELIKNRPSLILKKLVPDYLAKQKWLQTQLENYKASFVILGDDDYPLNLKNSPAPPIVLFIKGELNIIFDLNAVAVVGTRKPTDYGRRNGAKIVEVLVDNNLTTVSGLAFGIDSLVHKETIRNQGRTVAVIPTGLDNIYPHSHQPLAEQIVNNGGVIATEIGFGLKRVNRGSFPRRNRIIAGLAKFLVVIEGSSKSGTLITASQAISAGRDIYALPGQIDNSYAWATNFLIQQGAKPIISIQEFGRDMKTSPNSNGPKKKVVKKILTDKEKLVIDILSGQSYPLTIEELNSESNLDLNLLFQILSRLEFENIIRVTATGKYTLK